MTDLWQERAAYIETLPARKREYIVELIRRADILSDCLRRIKAYPVPSGEAQAEMEEFLTLLRDKARAELRWTEREYGVPEL